MPYSCQLQLGRSGSCGAPCGGRKVGAFFECHIEQGPILEADGKTIGVVTGGQAQRWYEVNLVGSESHAGTTPMERRRDALLGAARLIDMVNHIGMTHLPLARATCGVIESHPQSRNTVPGRVFLTVEFRHPDEAELSLMDQTFRAQAARNVQRLQPHALAWPCSLRSQPRPSEVPFFTAPRAGLYSQPTQPCQPQAADTSSITWNR